MILWYFHPHPVGGMSLPNHCFTCKYVRKECCRAAALVGGNAARVNVSPIDNIPVVILIIMIGIIMSYTTCTRPTWLTLNLHTKQEKNCNNLVSISLELLQTKPFNCDEAAHHGAIGMQKMAGKTSLG